MVEFTIAGRPLPWARAGHGQHGPRFTPTKQRNQMSLIRDAWNSLEVPAFARDEYLTLSAYFYFERPLGHFGTGRNAGLLKDKCRRLYPSRPDLDNLVKLVEDSLSGVAFHDDAQIVCFAGIAKRYADPPAMPRSVIRLWAV